jgi:hypothetical protein
MALEGYPPQTSSGYPSGYLGGVCGGFFFFFFCFWLTGISNQWYTHYGPSEVLHSAIQDYPRQAQGPLKQGNNRRLPQVGS